MSGFTRPICWAATIFAFVMTLLPQPPQLPGSPSDKVQLSDKVQHILAFATLAAGSQTGWPRDWSWLQFAGGGAGGRRAEIAVAGNAPPFDPNRKSGLADVLCCTVPRFETRPHHYLAR